MEITGCRDYFPLPDCIQPVLCCICRTFGAGKDRDQKNHTSGPFFDCAFEEEGRCADGSGITPDIPELRDF